MSPVLVFSTAGSMEEATRIAEAVVGERLAACVTVVPGVRSVYRWQGRVETAEEVLLVLKTTAPRLEALAARVRALHSYQVPEVVAVPITGGWPPYLAWLVEEVATPAAPEGGAAP
ncbi:MAG: divalent-cation tolerance protein CutA [Armatimonadota bacterium]|nr:divalent-cation tolerance protein CutA [Armatimonadota bacterium]MDR7532845.1 divalent-cation tolerance protein CutA [Armatimonadota bacterium]MDR7535151.1 divalent-cation tolerance protein CutA [Armatimonadota bacterium]